MFDRILQGFIRKVAAEVVVILGAAANQVHEEEATALRASGKIPDIRARRRVAGKVVSLGTSEFSADYSRDNCPSSVRWVAPPSSGK